MIARGVPASASMADGAATSPIRVARVIARLNIGGPAQHVIHLTARLPRDRFESVLLAGREAPSEGNMLDLAARWGVQPIEVPGLGRRLSPTDDARSLAFLVRFFRRFRPHVVHTHTAKAGAIGRLAARLTRVPIVVHTYHGHVFHGYFSKPMTSIFLAVERVLARSTSRLLTVSESVKRELETYRVGVPDQILAMPLGLDLDRFLGSEGGGGELRRELGVGDDRPLVGIVARLVPIKLHEDFVAASALVAARVPRALFLVIGDGERRSELEALVRGQGLAERVRFLGWRRDLDHIYRDLDVVVLTSANEGSPVSLIEAMAAARPVVATRVGGVPDLVEAGVHGLLVRPGDPAATADAIVALVADPARRRAMGEAGRRRVRDVYSVDRLVSDVARLYAELLPNPHPSSRR
jgi:glycosyltransferase involved in cell wall biosynthesis